MKIEVDSSDVLKAAIDLDAMEAAAIRAGYAVESIQQHSDYMAASIRVVRDQIEAEMASLLRAEGILQSVGGATQNATEQMHNFRFGVANVAAQFQDIAVTAQMGMNPMIIALQQGTQLSAALSAQGGGLRSMALTLRDAFVSVVSPVSLVTIGVVAATSALIQWSAANINLGRSSADALEAYHDKLEDIVAGYEEAGKLVSQLRERGGQLSIGAIEIQLGKFLEDAGKEMESIRRNAGNVAAAFKTSGRTVDQEFSRMIRSFLDGSISAAEYETELSKAASMNITFFSSFDDVQLQRFAAQLLEGAKIAKVYENALVDITHVLAEIGAETAPYNLRIALESSIEGDRSAIAHQIELDAITAKSPAQLADIARRRETLKLIDEEISETLRKQQIDQAAAEAYASAMFEITESQQQRLRAARDSNAEAELELSLVGQSIEEITRQRFVRQELAQAEEEAAQNGVSVSLSYIQAIEEIGAAYGRLQREIAERGTIADLMFARTQMGRSKTEATVAESLREIYGDDFASQMDGFIANQIRVNETLAEFDQIGQKATETWLVGFVEAWKANFLESETDKASARMQYASELLDETMRSSGEVTQERRLEIVRLSSAMAEAEYGATAMQRAWNSAWEAMGDISIKVLDQLANKALSMAANGIWDMIFAGVTGALGVAGPGVGAQSLGSIAGALAGAVTAGYANGVDQAPAGLAWVGERGPELMNFRGGEKVTSAPESMAALMQQMSRPVENHFHINAEGAELGVETRIANAMDEWERNRMPYVLKAYEENDTRVG